MSSRTFRLTIFQQFSGILHFLKSVFCSIATQTPRSRLHKDMFEDHDL